MNFILRLAVQRALASAVAEWGMDGAFPALRNLRLSWDDLQSPVATLPPEWGSNGGMASLQRFRTYGLVGQLPDSWGHQLLNLTELILGNGRLNGMFGLHRCTVHVLGYTKVL